MPQIRPMNRSTNHHPHPHQHSQAHHSHHPSGSTGGIGNTSTSSTPPVSRTSSSSARRREPRMHEPSTPTPPARRSKGSRARQRGAPPSQSRDAAGPGNHADPQGWTDGTDGTEDEELFGLLGVTSPSPSMASTETLRAAETGGGAEVEVEVGRNKNKEKRGVLSISRADIEASTSTLTSSPRARTPRKKGDKAAPDTVSALPISQANLDDDPTTSFSESERPTTTTLARLKSQPQRQSRDTDSPTAKSKSRSKTPRKAQAADSSANTASETTIRPGDPAISALSAQLASHPNPQRTANSSGTAVPLPMPLRAPVSDGPFDTALLSRSLPSSFFAPAQVARGAAADALGEDAALAAGNGSAGDEPAQGQGESKKRGKKKKARGEAGAKESAQGGAEQGDASAQAQIQAQGRGKGQGKAARGKQQAPPASSRKAGRGAGAGAGASTGVATGTDSDTDGAWDMPYSADFGPSDSQEMTWQQKLGSYPNANPAESPAPKSKSKSNTPTSLGHVAGLGPGTQAPSPLNPNPNPSAARPAHARRRSADASISTHSSMPLQLPGGKFPSTDALAPHARHTSANPTLGAGAASMPRAPPSAFTYQPSVMETLPPFNPAVNANRAPQTPARGGLAHRFAKEALPLLPGEFPRLGPGAGAVGAGGPMGPVLALGPGPGQAQGQESGPAGIKYAGAQFHSSPAASSLPKPDLDDF